MEKKKIALIAHDNKKQEIVEWACHNKQALSGYVLCGTGHTAKLVEEATGLPVQAYLSGPLGGDQQIGAKVAEGEIDAVVFFWDPLQMQPLSVWRSVHAVYIKGNWKNFYARHPIDPHHEIL